MGFLGYKPSQIRKALAGGIMGAAPLLVPDLADGALSQAEIGGLVAAFVAGVAVVFGIPNAQRPAGTTAAGPDRPSSSAGLY